MAALLLTPVVVPSIAWIAGSWGRPPDPRYASYAEAGRWLRTHTAADARVAAVEIGILGYFADRHVVDLMGLVTPEAVEARRAGELGELVLRHRATHLVDNPIFHREALEGVLGNPEIRRRYRPVSRIHRPPYAPIVIVSVEMSPGRGAGTLPGVGSVAPVEPVQPDPPDARVVEARHEHEVLVDLPR